LKVSVLQQPEPSQPFPLELVEAELPQLLLAMALLVQAVQAVQAAHQPHTPPVSLAKWQEMFPIQF
jgi:hypothetical protein